MITGIRTCKSLRRDLLHFCPATLLVARDREHGVQARGLPGDEGHQHNTFLQFHSQWIHCIWQGIGTPRVAGLLKSMAGTNTLGQLQSLTMTGGLNDYNIPHITHYLPLATALIQLHLGVETRRPADRFQPWWTHPGALYGLNGSPTFSDIGCAHIFKCLSTLEKLQQLSFQGHPVGLPGASALGDCLPQWTDLRRLNLSDTELTAVPLSLLSTKWSSTLQELFLDGNNLDVLHIAPLLPSLIRCNLTTLHLQGNRLSGDGIPGQHEMSRFFKSMGECTQLTDVNLNSTHSSDLGPHWMNLHWHHLPLRTLDYAQNDMGNEGIHRFATFLNHHSTLSFLDLSCNHPCDSGIRDWHVGGSNNTLQTLILDDTSIQAKGTLHLTLERLQGLSRLSLQDNLIQASGAKRLTTALNNQHSIARLTDLDLTGNPGFGARYTGARLLSRLTSLTRLKLSSCSMSQTALTNIAHHLSHSSLATLYLCYNTFGDGGILGTKPIFLRHLSLAGNDIGTHGATNLSWTLPWMRFICRLDISNSNLGPPGIAALSPGLRLCTTLVHLSLEANQLGNEGAAILARSIPILSLRQLDLALNYIDDVTHLRLLPHHCQIRGIHNVRWELASPST